MIQMTTEHEFVHDAEAFADVLGPTLEVKRNGRAVEFDVVRLPPLRVGSGRITACDGFILKGTPFSRPVPNGRHDLTLGIAVLGHDERVAFARVAFADAPAVRWVMATVAGEDLATLPAGKRFGYGVDYAKGCLADTAALAVVDAADLLGEMDGAAGEVYRPSREWLTLTAGKGSVAVFSSGFGDGYYSSYFGFDAADRLVALLTDFDVVDWRGRPQ